MKLKKLIGQVLTAIAMFISAALGLVALFVPAKISEALGVVAATDLGANTLRADFASFFLVSALLCAASLMRGKPNLLLVPCLLFGLAGVFRLFGALMDGVPGGFAQPLIIEFGITGMLLLARALRSGRSGLMR